MSPLLNKKVNIYIIFSMEHWLILLLPFLNNLWAHFSIKKIYFHLHLLSIFLSVFLVTLRSHLSPFFLFLFFTVNLIYFFPSTNINKVKHVRFIFSLCFEILCCFKFKEKNTQNSIPAESSILVGIGWNSPE